MKEKRRVIVRCLVVLLAFAIAGCSQDAGPTTKPSTVADRQEQALRDPFGYTPNLKKSDRSVSGENDPDALKKDLHDIFNP